MGYRIAKIVKNGPNEEDWEYTYYARTAQGDAISTYRRYFKPSGDLYLEGFPEYQISPSGQFVDIFTLKEHHLYGSKRLGTDTEIKPLNVLSFDNSGYDSEGHFDPTNSFTVASNPQGDPDIETLKLGFKQFELAGPSW